MNVSHLFPVPVAEFHIGRGLTDEERSFVLDHSPRQDNGGNKISTNHYILNEPALCDVKSFVDDCINQYARDVWEIRDRCSLELTQSWATYTRPGDFHHQHTHTNSMFSGVFYVQTDDTRDRLHFYRSLSTVLAPAYAEVNIFNSNSWWLPTPTGSLLLFPSTVPHAVVAFSDGVERCSIAFNTFPRGAVGGAGTLSELYV